MCGAGASAAAAAQKVDSCATTWLALPLSAIEGAQRELAGALWQDHAWCPRLACAEEDIRIPSPAHECRRGGALDASADNR